VAADAALLLALDADAALLHQLQQLLAADAVTKLLVASN